MMLLLMLFLAFGLDADSSATQLRQEDQLQIFAGHTRAIRHEPEALGCKGLVEKNGSHVHNSWLRKIAAELPASIPKRIIQTYFTKKPIPKLREFMSTWVTMNQDLGWHIDFYLDADAEKFVAKHFDELTHRVYRTLPVAAMKADLFRYAVLYVEGGVYTDIDTECKVPIDDWLPQHNGCKAIIGREAGAGFFNQWTFAAVPGHPVFKRAVELIVERVVQDGGVKLVANSVHYYTGPALWTDAVLDTIGMDTSSCTCESAVDCIFANPDLPEVKESGICFQSASFFMGDMVGHAFHHDSKDTADGHSWTTSVDRAGGQFFPLVD